MSHFDNSHQNFASHLEKYIIQSAHSISQIARLADIPRRTLANWTSGYVRKPRRPDDLLRVCRALNLSPTETQELFDLAGLAAPDGMINEAPFHIGLDLPYFVGREGEIKQVKEAVLSQQAKPIYAFTGMAGVGKTALAWHLAHQLHPHFRDGVLWAQLDKQDAIETTLSSFALAFGVEVASLPDLDSKSRVLRTLLASKQVLIILDNVEKFEDIAPIIPPTGKSLVIVTTQQQTFGVLQGIDRLEIMPFDTEAWALIAHFLPDERIKKETKALSELIENLGGLPLALAIAMSRLAYEPQWTVHEFIEQMQSIHALENQNISVYRAFRVAYQGLDSALQQTLTTLGLFSSDSITAEAVSYILEDSFETTTKQLNKLCHVSLIRYVGDHRYHLHPLIWQFARDLAQADGLRNRYKDYYQNFIQANSANYQKIDKEFEHILLMLNQLLETDANAALVDAIKYIFEYLENRSLLSRILQHIETLYERLLVNDDKQSLTIISYYYGRLCRRLGNWDEGEKLTQLALNLAIKTEQSRIALLSHNSLGIHAQNQGNFDCALDHFSAARKIIEAEKRYAYRYSNLLNTATVLRNLGRYDEARNNCLKVLYHIEDVDSETEQVQTMVCFAYASLCDIARQTGDSSAQKIYYKKGISLAHRLDNQDLIQEFLENDRP